MVKDNRQMVSSVGMMVRKVKLLLEIQTIACDVQARAFLHGLGSRAIYPRQVDKP